MRIDIATLFPDMCEAVLSESIVGRARKAGHIDIHCHNIRDYTQDKHRRVDDALYGGGMGMLMQPEPIYRCCMEILRITPSRPHIIYLSAQGSVLTQKRVQALSQMQGLLLICGHYEGVDQRLIDEIVDEEISIGDYVLTGGELGALVLTDAVARLCDGVLPQESCYTEESHYHGLLEYPQYTRPPEWMGRQVPEILLSGHHANIDRWRAEQSVTVTLQKRPDLLEKADLTVHQKKHLSKLLEDESK